MINTFTTFLLVLGFVTGGTFAADIDIKQLDRDRVLKAADQFVHDDPITVTAFVCPRSAGGPHDFYSEGDYWWPDPKNPDGPYIQKDGLTNPENLTAEQRHELQELKQQFPQLKQLADQREELRAIFNNRKIQSPTEGRRHLQAWLEQVQALGVTALKKFCTTLHNWRDPIANYFRSRGSNGRTEGLNHGLRAILWRAFGMANFHNFRLRVLHCFGLGLA
jgi:hypothetical protein